MKEWRIIYFPGEYIEMNTELLDSSVSMKDVLHKQNTNLRQIETLILKQAV